MQALKQLNNQLKIKQLKQNTATCKKAVKLCFSKKKYAEFGIPKYTGEQIRSL